MTRKTKIRVYKSVISGKYRMILPTGIELIIMPNMVRNRSGEILAVGASAAGLYDAIYHHDTRRLKSLLPTILYIASLFAQ